MDHHTPSLLQTYRTRGYPIDLELRRAHRARRGSRRRFQRLRELAARVSQRGRR